MQVSGSDVLAFFALLVSFAAAFYAKRAVDMARIANRISLHEPRAKIFENIFHFRSLFVEMDLHPTDDEMQNFYRNVVLPAHLYLPSKFTEQLHGIYLRSRTLYDQILLCESGQSPDSKWTYINRLQEIGKVELDQLIRDLTSELDLGNT